MAGYRDLFDASISDPAAFWADAARAVTWTREPKQILDDSNPPFYRWFPDGELNTCANALDRHVEGGRGEQPATNWPPASTMPGTPPSSPRPAASSRPAPSTTNR